MHVQQPLVNAVMVDLLRPLVHYCWTFSWLANNFLKNAANWLKSTKCFSAIHAKEYDVVNFSENFQPCEKCQTGGRSSKRVFKLVDNTLQNVTYPTPGSKMIPKYLEIWSKYQHSIILQQLCLCICVLQYCHFWPHGLKFTLIA